MLEASSKCRIASFTSVDLFGTYQLNDKLELTVNKQNVFNRLAPLDTVTYGGVNYNPSLHQTGAIGRYFHAGARYRF
jgi:iron complex outermembrane receptor protein